MKDRSRRADGSYLASHGRWYGVGPHGCERVHKSASFFTSSVAAVMQRRYTAADAAADAAFVKHPK